MTAMEGRMMPSSNKRELCWRARKLEDGTWCYGQLVVFESEGWMYEKPDVKIAIDVETKGESIGLNDIDGKLIYEGDLLLSKDDDNSYKIFVVVHRGVCFVGKQFNGEEYIDLTTHNGRVVGQYYSSTLERDLQDIKKSLDLITQGEGKGDEITAT